MKPNFIYSILFSASTTESFDEMAEMVKNILKSKDDLVSVVLSGMSSIDIKVDKSTGLPTVSLKWADLVEYLTDGKPSTDEDQLNADDNNVVRWPIHNIVKVQLNADCHMVPVVPLQSWNKPFWYIYNSTGAVAIGHDALMSVSDSE